MKKIYLFASIGCFFLGATKLSAQCAGNRYHDFVFTDTIVTKDVVYGSNASFTGSIQSLKLDVYEPENDTLSERPLIIWAHGGSFVGGSKSDAPMIKLCTDFAKLGYVVASIDYRLLMTNIISISGPDSTDAGAAVMRAVHDARASVRYFKKNYAEGGNTYRVDTNNIFFAGASAGGFMALHLAYMDEWSEFPSYIDTTGTGPDAQPGLHGGIEGLSGNQGYSSKVKAILNLSGAISDTAWMHTGDTPLLSTHATDDGTVPYGTEMIYLTGNWAIQVVDGSASVTERANEVGIVNCFKTYYNDDHVPEQTPVIYDTSLCLMRNFLEHFTCGIPLDCNYTGKVTGIENIAAADASVNLYPNPSTSDITVEFTALGGKNIAIELYDVMGRKIKSVSGIKTGRYTITRDNLPRGIYSVNIIAEGKVLSKKVIFE